MHGQTGRWASAAGQTTEQNSSTNAAKEPIEQNVPVRATFAQLNKIDGQMRRNTESIGGCQLDKMPN
jgi:hypothetical protein